jgi:hypothetical protein
MGQKRRRILVEEVPLPSSSGSRHGAPAADTDDSAAAPARAVQKISKSPKGATKPGGLIRAAAGSGDSTELSSLLRANSKGVVDEPDWVCTYSPACSGEPS